MKKSQLHHIKNTGFEIPETYFDTFDERLQKKMEMQDIMTTVSDPGHKVPDHYFQDFDQILETQLHTEKSPKVKTLMTWRNVALISGMAASLLLMFKIFNTPDDVLSINQIETASIEDYLKSENLTTFDLASFLNDDDLEIDNFVTNTLSAESLENYLLNNASIEDLIFE